MGNTLKGILGKMDWGMGMSYRRLYIPGGTYFFTVVTYRRKPLFANPRNVQLLRQAFHQVKAEYPFTIEAIVVLPDHIHAIWTLPEGDADFSHRWRRIKTYFSLRYKSVINREFLLPNSRLKKGERDIWQRRFWEHVIRDPRDLQTHVDYIHYNPVKHGLVKHPGDWEYSSFRRYGLSGNPANME